MSKQHKKTCKTLNYFEHLLILTSTFTGVFRFLLFLLSLVFLWELQVLQLDLRFYCVLLIFLVIILGLFL